MMWFVLTVDDLQPLMWLGFWLSNGDGILWWVVHVWAGWHWMNMVLVAFIDEHHWTIDLDDEWTWFTVGFHFEMKSFLGKFLVHLIILLFVGKLCVWSGGCVFIELLPCPGKDFYGYSSMLMFCWLLVHLGICIGAMWP